MITIAIPGDEPLELDHAVFDFNGTIAVDGSLREGVASRLQALSEEVDLCVITGDTFGTAREALAGLPVRLEIVSRERQAEAKLALLRSIGAQRAVAVGNGHNDRSIISEAALGIVVLEREGCAGETLQVADVVCASILDALDLLLHPQRLVATLRR